VRARAPTWSTCRTTGGKYCIGRRVRYRSCATQDCDWQAKGFRETQCSTFDGDNRGIHGVPTNVRWLPKYEGIAPIDRCHLYCQVEGSAAFYKLAEKVVDGTACGRHDHDMCVDGECRPAGCDHRLDSSMTRDICGASCVRTAFMALGRAMRRRRHHVRDGARRDERAPRVGLQQRGRHPGRRHQH